MKYKQYNDLGRMKKYKITKKEAKEQIKLALKDSDKFDF